MADTSTIDTNAVQEKAFELVDQLVAGLKGLTPQLADAALAALQLTSIASIGIGFAWFLIATIFAGVALKLARTGLATYRRVAESKSSAHAEEACTGWFVSGGISGVASAILFIVSLNYLLSPSDWVKAIEPRAGLAMMVIDRVLK